MNNVIIILDYIELDIGDETSSITFFSSILSLSLYFCLEPDSLGLPDRQHKYSQILLMLASVAPFTFVLH